MSLYVGSTALLLPGTGTDGSTVFTDTTGKTVTPYGNAKISTAQSVFSGSSMAFDGTGDYLSIGHSPDLILAGANYTIEAWVRLAAYSSGNGQILDKDGVAGTSYSQYNLNVTSAGKLNAFVGNGNGVSPTGVSLTGATTVPLNTWQHIALVNFYGVTLLFLHGVKEAFANTPPMFDGGKPLLIGYQAGQPASVYFNGHIQDVSITQGLALYTDSFTPTAAPRALVSPVQVAVQAQNQALTKLAKYDPSQTRPAAALILDDLQDRWPYGPWKTPAVQWEFKGRGVVSGTVKTFGTPNNTPVARLVRLHREPDGMFVKAVWSDPTTGAYSFVGVRPDCKYFVTSFDHQHTYRAVVADNLIVTAL